MWTFVLVIMNTKTQEVEVKGPWDNQEAASEAARAFLRGKSKKDAKPYRLAVAPVAPMVYYVPPEERR